MSHRQAYIASTSDGLLGGAFVVVGFFVLVVVTAVDLITSRWSTVPTFEPAQAKKGSSFEANDSSIPDSVKPSADETKPLSENVSENIQSPSGLPSDPEIVSQENQLSDPVKPSRDEAAIGVPLVQDQDLKQSEPTSVVHNHEEAAVANDSSQEWVSLSKPDDSVPSIETRVEEPSTSLVPPQHETPQADASSSQLETTLEFSSATLLEAPNTAMTIRSDTSSPTPSTPEPDSHSFDATRIQSVAAPLNPGSSAEFELKGRTSTSSLHSASGSINRAGTVTSELSSKKKRGGGSFIRKSSTLVNKVFRSRDASNDDGNLSDSPQLGSSLVSDPEEFEHSTSAPDAATTSADSRKRLTSPSRVSLGSIRSIGGSIRRKIGKSSAAGDKDGIAASTVTAAVDQEPRSVTPEEPLPSNSSQSSSTGKVADATSSGPSLLKTMFKVRKPSK